MAKRREQKDETESKDFEMPKFDKEGFINKEKEKIKATFIAFAFAFVIALISFGFWVLLENSPFQWALVILFGIFSASWIQYLFKQFSVDMEKIERKGMFSSFAIYLFSWLFILIVLVNPPFYDAESPQIELVTLPDMQEPGGSVKIIAKITDNSGIKDNEVELTISQSNVTIVESTMILEDNILLYEFENDENRIGSFKCTLVTEDISGKKRSLQTNFTYSENTIKLPTPAGATTPPGPTITYADELAIDVKADVDRVSYTVNAGSHSERINATQPSDEFYRTTPRMKGWKKDSNITLNIQATSIHYFLNDARMFENTIVDNTTYYVVTTDADEIGTEDPPSISLPRPSLIQVPGFELIVFLISIIGVLLIIKHKKSGKKNKS